MNKNLQKLLEIAEDNVARNPSIVGKDTLEVATRYLTGLGNEVDEVAAEFKDNNTIHLQDELSDIVWNYFVVLKICEKSGWIDSPETVFTDALTKYTERAPAFLEADETMWEEIKKKQKEDLMKRHRERYGN